ncbi:MAG: hypothetical protein SFV24_17580 [Gemmatimonadales bacterium]|nr:hypothetical protein [Gemmatimonadales bacterium]
MPTSKDLKRLVRSRMQKTGESYTAARARLLEKQHHIPPDAATRAGMTDAAVRAKTGRTWPQWVRALDGVGAAALAHRDIAVRVRRDFGIGAWWSQTVTVGYERIRGLREIGQRRGGGFEANKSKVIAAPLSRVFRAVHDARLRAEWLPEANHRLKSATARKAVRFIWGDGSKVEVRFGLTAAGKCQVAVQHTGLADRAAAARMKAYWAAAVAALAAAVSRP